MQRESWIIDGFGPLDILEKRLQLADQIVFIDFPLRRHFWWCAKRQIENIWLPRTEIPEDCNEATWSQTMKLFKSVWNVHYLMRPELLKILHRPNNEKKLISVTNLQQWNALFHQDIEVQSR